MFEPQTNVDWSTSLLWLGAIAIVSFLASWLLTDVLRLRRSIYVGALALITAGLTAGYLAWSGAGTEFWTSAWAWGIVGAILTGAFLALGVSRAPITTSDHSSGIGAFLWEGVVYGATEGLLLSVLPIVVVWGAFADLDWTDGWRGVVAAVAAIAASAAVIVVHHLGYEGYRGRAMRFPVMGCSVLSLGYLVTASPIAAMGGHILLHAAMMRRGVALPPHSAVVPEASSAASRGRITPPLKGAGAT